MPVFAKSLTSHFKIFLFSLAVIPTNLLLTLTQIQMQKSRVRGLEFAAVKAMASAITADVHVDNDTQEMTCNLYVRFPSFAQAVFTIGGIRVQENLNVIVGLRILFRLIFLKWAQVTTR